MFKLIIKNLWSRRRRNAMLLIELIIITVVAWVSLDTVIVNTYVRNMPLGYDMERFVQIDFGHEGLKAEDENDDARERALKRFASNLESLPEVESVSRIDGNMFESTGYSVNVLASDTVNHYSFFSYSFIPGWDMFATLGVKSVGRSPSTEELTSRTYARGEIVMSESGARLLFGDKDPVGSYIGKDLPDFKEEDAYKVVGVVTDIRPRSNESDALVFYRPNAWREYDWEPSMMIRLKEGVSPRSFVNEYRDMMTTEFRGGNIFCYKVAPMTEFSDEYLYQSGYTNSMRLRVVLAVFFLVNLCLGIVGTFLLQTRKRTEDAGVMLSFGATPRRIRAMLLGEGAVLTTVACAVGFFIYYYIAKAIGLANGTGNMNVDMRPDVPWIASFGEHFAIVSLIIYLLILVTVLVGIYIPARRISCVNPVDALRDE